MPETRRRISSQEPSRPSPLRFQRPTVLDLDLDIASRQALETSCISRRSRPAASYQRRDSRPWVQGKRDSKTRIHSRTGPTIWTARSAPYSLLRFQRRWALL
ncbi:hypothetical protein CF326_g9690 [Tilletia indica]|uniref:Uncharacterized protein n=1 Tax=Tilletia indica TaxID=43049 RepID=A0A8T8SBZ0_9BASI|nr:hypothetical protein CF326_g9690 [Tilletia indica]KAE8236641.1 hypothetical protein A4X13_0g9080 [Tilletia indica]